ncbi:flagellar hook-associated protein FlgK [Arcobacter sp. LA11]|uniref:flagellar hook-associated protein FlgK n=1 Tax=Arcobacter sp. LA11 TaxID=1898176 RepID=UPI000934F239|nr:flagellar hook-associated protein FlgK [Arcobacter sp. LA11]
MMDSLYTAQSGLFTSRYAIDATSNNIANENTEGYKKRVVNTSELSSLESNIGNGVSFDGITRTTNQFLYNQLIKQTSEQSFYEQEDEILSQIEIMFQETDSSGFSVSLNDYFQSIENLRSNPSNEIYKSDLENQSEILVFSLKDLYSDLETIEENIFTQLSNDVDQVNEILSQIVYLNEQIQSSSQQRDDLLDKRDQLEKELSDYANIEVDTSNDNYTLKIAGATTIFNGVNLHEISITQEEDRTFINVYNNELNLSSGSLKSLSENLSDDSSSIYSTMQSLDDFAKALIDEVNANSTTAIFSGDSVSNMSFDSSAISDLTNDNLENLAQIQWGEYSIDSTSTDISSFSEFYQSLRVEISSKVENNDFKLEAQESVVQSLQTSFDNFTKVDSDEEMIKLIEYQAAYEANAKVITVVDEMLQTLLDM